MACVELSVFRGTRPSLACFDTTPGDVLLIDNELHPETLASRLNHVAHVNGIEIAELADRVMVLPLRGSLKDCIPLVMSLSGTPQTASSSSALMRFTAAADGS